MRFSIMSVGHIHPLASKSLSQRDRRRRSHISINILNEAAALCTTLREVDWQSYQAFLVICAVKTPNHPVPARCHTGGSQRSENNNFDDQDMTDTKTKSSPCTLWIHLELLTFGICHSKTAFVWFVFFLCFYKCNLYVVDVCVLMLFLVRIVPHMQI